MHAPCAGRTAFPHHINDKKYSCSSQRHTTEMIILHCSCIKVYSGSIFRSRLSDQQFAISRFSSVALSLTRGNQTPRTPRQLPTNRKSDGGTGNGIATRPRTGTGSAAVSGEADHVERGCRLRLVELPLDDRPVQPMLRQRRRSRRQSEVLGTRRPGRDMAHQTLLGQRQRIWYEVGLNISDWFDSYKYTCMHFYCHYFTINSRDWPGLK